MHSQKAHMVNTPAFRIRHALVLNDNVHVIIQITRQLHLYWAINCQHCQLETYVMAMSNSLPPFKDMCASCCAYVQYSCTPLCLQMTASSKLSKMPVLCCSSVTSYMLVVSSHFALSCHYSVAHFAQPLRQACALGFQVLVCRSRRCKR